jgi:hypothetical protein
MKKQQQVKKRKEKKKNITSSNDDKDDYDNVSKKNKKWKRLFMHAEHERRKLKRKLDADLFEKDIEGICNMREIRLMKEQRARDKNMISGQHRVIQRLHDLLKENGIPEPVGTQVASFKTCRASDDEICPLSLQLINSSTPPYDHMKHPPITVDPRKPHHKCAELGCGHRFNSLWLLFHFVSQRTFRCPICRRGYEDFHFQMEQLPAGLVDMVKDAAGVKK